MIVREREKTEKDAISITERRDKKNKREKNTGTASRGRETYLLCEGVMVLEGFAD